MKIFIRRYLAVILLVSFFALLYSAWSINRHNNFGTDAVDLAIFDQPIWHWSRFEAPLSSIKYNQLPGAHILGDHFHPILILIAPLYWLWNDVRVLLILQATLVSISAFPIYKIAKILVPHRYFPLAVSFSFLAFFGIQSAIDYDFHETTLAVLPFSLSLLFMVEGKTVPFFTTFILGLLFKEDMPLYYAMVGFILSIRFKKYRLGFIVFGISLIYYFLVTQKIIPAFKGDRFAYEELDARLGKTTFDLIRTSLVTPWVTLWVLITPLIKFKAIVNYFASYSFLPLLDPLSLALIIPNFVSRYLTELPQRWILRFQYGAMLSPILAFGAIYSTNQIRDLLFSRYLPTAKFLKSETFLNLISILLVVAPLVQTYRTGSPLFKMLNPKTYISDYRIGINRDLLFRIPKDASVMAQSAFVPHLSHRSAIFRYEDSLLSKYTPDYILMSLDEHTDPPYSIQELSERIEALRINPLYETVFWDGKRLLLRRKST